MRGFPVAMSLLKGATFIDFWLSGRKKQKFQLGQSYSCIMRQVRYHRIWIQNNLGFMVSGLIYIHISMTLARNSYLCITLLISLPITLPAPHVLAIKVWPSFEHSILAQIPWLQSIEVPKSFASLQSPSLLHWIQVKATPMFKYFIIISNEMYRCYEILIFAPK